MAKEKTRAGWARIFIVRHKVLIRGLGITDTTFNDTSHGIGVRSIPRGYIIWNFLMLYQRRHNIASTKHNIIHHSYYIITEPKNFNPFTQKIFLNKIIYKLFTIFMPDLPGFIEYIS